MNTQPNAPINPSRHLNDNGQIDAQYKGLTKREYFAAMAMQGILAGNYKELASNIGIPAIPDVLTFAVKYADALINELNKE